MRKKHTGGLVIRCSGRWLVWVLLAVAGGTLTGCTMQRPAHERLPEGGFARVELAQTPFYAQDAYQCGPASLAMVLADAGAAVSPDELVSKVYIPGRRGSLQHELVAAARGYGRVPYVIDATLDGLVAELDAGRPVLILQNLGLARLPRWHYAVVIGYDRESQQLVLRSGLRERLEEPLRSFHRTWSGGGRWGMVVLEPGDLPARPDPQRLLETASAFEELGRPDIAAASYAAMAQRWPQRPAVIFGLAHSQHLMGRHTDAAKHYRHLLEIAGPHPAVLNNLSLVLLELGCVAAARIDIETAIDLAEAHGDQAALRVLEQTRARIRSEAQAGAIDGPGTDAAICP
jgi:tetratricopeptide (TPR) repeat protein